MKKLFTPIALVVFALSFFLPSTANACFSCIAHHQKAVTYQGYANQYLQKYNQSYNHHYYTKYLYYNNQSNHYTNLCNSCTVSTGNYNNNNYNNNNNNCRVNTYRVNSYKRYANNYNKSANRNLRLYKTTGRYSYKNAYTYYRNKCSHYRKQYTRVQNSCND